MPIRSSLCLMASMVREGAISPEELVEAHLAQIAARNPEIHAVVTVFAEEARARARSLRGGSGLLYGVPVTVKGSFDLAAAVVKRMESEGAIVLGRTNIPEVLARYETDNPATGRTNNPWDLERTPGGSSGGEAAAIAAFCSPGGVASDGGGSIRVPAHFCGIAGLKPTPGRVPASGHTPALGYPGGLVTTVGPMARSALDLRLLFSAMAGYDAADVFSAPVGLRVPVAENVRLGVWEQFYAVPVEDEIRAAVRRAAGLARDLGWTVDGFEPRGLERAPNLWAFLFAQWLEKGKEITGAEVLTNLAARSAMRASLLRQMEGVSAILMPVFGITAFRHGESRWTVGGREIGLFHAGMPAVVANVLGLPAVTIPMGVTAGGMPVGVQLMGRPFEDELLLELAVLLEEARGR